MMTWQYTIEAPYVDFKYNNENRNNGNRENAQLLMIYQTQYILFTIIFQVLRGMEIINR